MIIEYLTGPENIQPDIILKDQLKITYIPMKKNNNKSWSLNKWVIAIWIKAKNHENIYTF